MTLDRKSFSYFVIAAFALHAWVLVLKLREDFGSRKISQHTEPVKVNFLPDMSAADVAALQKKQIVQSEDSANNEKPKTEAFLSDKDRSFDRETLSKAVNTFQKAGKGDSSVTNPERKQQTAKTQKKAMKDLKLTDLGMGAGEMMAVEQTRAPASVQGIENGDLSTQGMSATNDYVEEVALGDFTHLNTTEYKHYGFFHRIRQKLEQFWGKSLHEKANNIFRSGRRLPASDSLITSLRVTLNTKGEIVNVKILGTSGVRELDDAAIESFNEAGPFPNPPKDLLVNGEATIEWGFVVKS